MNGSKVSLCIVGSRFRMRIVNLDLLATCLDNHVNKMKNLKTSLHMMGRRFKEKIVNLDLLATCLDNHVNRMYYA
ncbi:MAG: hypothetical protein DWQ07_23465 [Chloroflexi bacterium]|nr:MAG: hypothetical protein DWQ07_23465 [Chloroflexota bacterium]MBL1194109.1 hypothetical protein [Chloroflexota bacterium]